MINNLEGWKPLNLEGSTPVIFKAKIRLKSAKKEVRLKRDRTAETLYQLAF